MAEATTEYTSEQILVRIGWIALALMGLGAILYVYSGDLARIINSGKGE